MTVNEMERKSGLDRANIRFYEKEGLLTPERKENGYRDYSEEDLQLLLRIKLLRRLDFSLDSIRALKEGNAALEEALNRRLAGIGAQRQALNATEQVCREMRQDGAQFQTLDAQRYLRSYDSALRLPANPTIRPTVPQSDRVLPPRTPWRRWLARMLDLTITNILIMGVLAIVFRVNINNIPGIVEWLLGYVNWALLIPLEALLLSKFGTTPGKWIMGLRLEHADGRKLEFSHAATRTWEVFGRGYGYGIPIYNYYRMWKSYKEVRDGEEPEWDYNVTQYATDYHWWRTVAYIAATVALFLIMLWAALVPTMPKHRGDDLTVAEFVENYNKLARFHDVDDEVLGTDGVYRANNGTVTIYIEDSDSGELELQFEESDGVLQAVSYERECSRLYYGSATDSEGKQAIQLTVMSLAWADSNMIKTRRSVDVLNEFIAHQEGTLEREILGWRLTYEIVDLEDAPDESETFRRDKYQVSFCMEKMA